MIAISKAVLMPYDVADHTNPQDDGTVTVSYQNGEVLSVQPDGSFQRRPEGTNGIYERGMPTPQGLIYCPDGAHAWLVPWAPKVPQ